MTMLKKEDKENIEHYIKGEASDNEKNYVESLFSDGENNLYLRQSLERDWDHMLRDTIKPGVDLSHLLDHIHHVIRRSEVMGPSLAGTAGLELYYQNNLDKTNITLSLIHI